MPTAAPSATRIDINTFVRPDHVLAHIYVGSVLVTQARGRNEECAVADAVAKFRTSRCCRRAA